MTASLPLACSDETKAVEFMEQTRWGGAAYCPRCRGVSQQMKGRGGGRNARFLWYCNECRRQFSVRTGTVFEDSRVGLRHWCFAFWVACNGGVNASIIHRNTGISYKTALFVLWRMRYAMDDLNTTNPRVEIGAPLVESRERVVTQVVMHGQEIYVVANDNTIWRWAIGRWNRLPPLPPRS